MTTTDDSITSPPPSLLFDDPRPQTNSAALLLPHVALFDPSILAILQDHYASFGSLAHWAPVKGFGRVIVVWDEIASAERALKEGDYLRLDVDFEQLAQSGVGGGNTDNTANGESNAASETQRPFHKPTNLTKSKNKWYVRRPRRLFMTAAKQTQGSITHSSTILRLFPLPLTTLNPDPASIHLAPPASDKNFLISPPGSPPEGWEPVVEEAPNSTTLADDLQRALESLLLNGSGGSHGHGRKSSREIILDEGGVRVQVEDTDMQEDEAADQEWGVEERLSIGVGASAWEMPVQTPSLSAAGTPSGKTRIIPTAMPPRPGQG